MDGAPSSYPSSTPSPTSTASASASASANATPAAATHGRMNAPASDNDNDLTVNEASPSFARRVPAVENSSAPHPAPSSSAPAPSYHPPTSRSGHSGLHEFQSLLEAAEQIANSPSWTRDHSIWSDDSPSDPIIRRSTHVNELRRSMPLTRQYSGRPHVPGEDSGSEAGDASSEQDTSGLVPPADPLSDPASLPLSSRLGDGGDSAVAQSLEHHYERRDHDRRMAEATQAVQRAASRAQAQRELSLVRQRRREEILARSRERLAQQNMDITRITQALDRPSRMSSEPVSTSQSHQEWASDPEDLHPAIDQAASRADLDPLGRWPPSERLQDYANGSTTQPTVDSALGATAAPEPTMRSRFYADEPTSDARDHNDIVDRVERALREYRIARRALRAQQEEAARGPEAGSRMTDTVNTRALTPHTPTLSPTTRDALAARHVRDNLDQMQELISNDLPPRSDSDEPWRTSERVAPLRRPATRQQVPPWFRERRRRFLLDTDNNLTFTSGPLFEASASYQDPLDTPNHSGSWRSDARAMLEKVRRAEARAKSKELNRAKSALRYLAALRDDNMNPIAAWTLASDLGLHNQTLAEDANGTLPLSVDDLPCPAYSSWLEPGLTWVGTQSADESEDSRALRARRVSDALRRAREQRDRVNLAARQNEVSGTRLRREETSGPLERTLMPGRTESAQRTTHDNFISVAQNSMQVLEEAERDLSSMLERSERLLQENERQLQQNEIQLRYNRQRLIEHDEHLARLQQEHRSLFPEPVRREAPAKPRDRWNVKVTLHEVDWDSMTVTGTMTASSTPESELSKFANPSSVEPSASTSMDSFFTGEIIDFATHGLDTVASQNKAKSTTFASSQQDWKTSGPDTDLAYWASIGPFKQAIDDAIDARELEIHNTMEQQELEKLLPDAPTTTVGASPRDSTGFPQDSAKVDAGGLEPLSTMLSDSDRHDLRLKTMHDLLTDKSWLHANINQTGWILMRWKERCFVAPGAGPNPEPTRPWIPSRPTFDPQRPTARSSPLSSFSFADTYRRDRNRVYTTNAAERDELGGSSEGQTMWGLTISGFYYVALHRQTGRIEGLYCDRGSAPFQMLKMTPAAQDATARYGEKKITKEPDQETVIGGLRTNFNIVEFR